MDKLVSVVMSTYKTKKEFLDESIKSILTQTYSNIEFIIICDGSIDDYNYIQNKYTDNRIRLIFHKENQGLPKSLNEGITIARGEYIARMDSDDIAIDDRLQSQVSYMERNNDVEMCGMYAKCFGSENRKARVFFTKPEELEILSLYYPVFIHPTVMFRKSFFNKGIYYNENYLCSQDMELWTKSACHNNMAIVKKYGLCYRIHENQAGIAKRKQQLYYVSLIREMAAKKMEGLPQEQIIKVLEMLYGEVETNERGFCEVYNAIDIIIKNSHNFNPQTMKRVFYQRMFVLLCKYKLFGICFKPRYFTKIFNATNMKYLFWRLQGGLR